MSDSMISLLWKAFKQNNEKARQQSDEEKLDEMLSHLTEGINEEQRTQDNCSKQLFASSKEEAIEWNCTKNEGVVTSLSNFGGTINDKYSFHKVIARNEWRKLKVGTKINFLLYSEMVRSLAIEEEEWTCDGGIKKPTIERITGYNTDERSVLGNIIGMHEDILVIETRYHDVHVTLSEYPNIALKFEIGDSLKLDCVIQEDATNIFKSESILVVNDLKPNASRIDEGRVTAVEATFVVFDTNAILFMSPNDTRMEHNEIYKFEAIETNCIHEGRCFDWRIIRLFHKVDKNSKQQQNDDNFRVRMQDELITLRQSHQTELEPITRSTTIYNNSQRLVKLVSCELTSNSGLIRLDKTQHSFTLRANSGRYDIYFKIWPKLSGLFVEELTVNFDKFQRKIILTLQIDETSPNVRSGKDHRNNDHLIPGQKVRQAPRFIDVRIKDYNVSDQLRNIDFKKNYQLVLEDLKASHRFLFEPLKKENYIAKMRHYIFFEEIAMEIFFARYKIERAHFENCKDYLRLAVKDVHEKRPSIGLGDSIRAEDPFPSKIKQPVYEGFIHKVENDAVLVKFHRDFHKNHDNKDYHIDFFFARGTFRRQQHALDQVAASCGLGFEFLFPHAKCIQKKPQLDVVATVEGNFRFVHQKRELKWFNQSLNIYQKNAVLNVLRGECRPLPYLIYGPPGSGKTKTVIECIQQISDKIPWSRIIIATPSNSAANLIADLLIESGRFKVEDFIRFVSQNQIEKELLLAHLMKYCATISIAFDSGHGESEMTTLESGLRLNCSKSMIKNFRVIISTLGSLGPLMQIKFPQGHFTHVIIDEAGQSVETETLIAISMLNRNRSQVILAGDPKQLGPVLVSQIGKSFGFDMSLLERLTKYPFYAKTHGVNQNEFDERFVTKLKKNYRALPSIVHIYNNLFYENELEAEVSEENSNEIAMLRKLDELLWNPATANKKCGVYFVNINQGKNQRILESSSWYNDAEASCLFLFLCKLNRKGIDLKNVGVITPYALQVKKLRSIINECLPDSKVKIGTVEEFQGQERDIILISTVRTNRTYIDSDVEFGLGFLQSSKRMNVAISRARALMIVFGKESLLAQDDNWRSLIQYTKHNGTYVTDYS